jgi:hypothetical protein
VGAAIDGKLQEFLILESNGDVGVYTVRQFPRGTPIGPDAQRLRVVGPSRVEPTCIHLTRLEFDRWRRELASEGRQVTLGPFWTSPNAFLPLEELIRQGHSRSLEEVREERLREADARSNQEDQRMAPVESPDS